MRLIKFLLPILVIGAGVGLFRHFHATKVEPDPIQSRLRPPVVAAMVVKPQSLAPELTLFGRIEAPNNSVLSAGIAADVMEVTVREGNFVPAGNVVVRLDDADAALEILQRKASVAEIDAQIESDRRSYTADREALEREQEMLALMQKAVARARALARTSAGTQATLDDALHQEQQLLLAITQRRRNIDDHSARMKLWKARLDNAEAALSRAEHDYSRTRIRAPYSGRVIEVLVSPGDRVTPGIPLVRMYDHLLLEVRAQVPRRYVPLLRESIEQGREIVAILQNDRGEFRLMLDRLAAAVTRGQGGVDAFFRAGQGTLPALGSTVELALELPSLDGVVAIPPDALYGDDRVYRIVGGRLESRAVTRLGLRRDAEGGRQLLLDGAAFEEGDLVMVSRLPQAINGLEVETGTVDD